MTRLFWIVLVMLNCAFLFAQIEYEVVGAMPVGHEVVDYFDFNDDGVEEIVTILDSTFYIFNTELQVQSTYSVSDFSQYFPDQPNIEDIEWEPVSGTHFFRRNGEICVAVCYTVTCEVDYSFHKECKMRLDFLELSNMSILSCSENLVEQYFNDGYYESIYSFKQTGFLISGNQMFVSIIATEDYSCDPIWSEAESNRLFVLDFSDIGQDSVATLNEFEEIGTQFFVANESLPATFTGTDFRTSYWSDGSNYADYSRLRLLKIENNIETEVFESSGEYSCMYEQNSVSEEIPLAGGIIPEGCPATYDV
ncbi:MAG: hypothetical protein K8S56_00325, partial [Candidatus Cloacimonetes bacterium]|nr:hypothetical protein [Candidatus Cloacimonadota bacterium]